MLFSEKLLISTISLISLIVFISNDYITQDEFSEFIWGLIISAVFISFLIKDEIHSYFKITKEEKIKYIKRISIFTACISIVGIVLIYIESI